MMEIVQNSFYLSWNIIQKRGTKNAESMENSAKQKPSDNQNHDHNLYGSCCDCHCSFA